MSLKLLLSLSAQCRKESRFGNSKRNYAACVPHIALLHLANTNNQLLAEYLQQHPFGDVDKLLRDEALEVESVSYGSWVAVVRSKATGVLDAIVAVATIFVPRAQDAFLRKLEADAELKEVDAKRAAVALRRDELELSKARSEYILDLVNRAGDRKTQEIMQKRLRQAVYDLASGDENEQEIRTNARRLLSGRRDKK
jgi:hypothetical protein